jgi:hypothetical protein
MRIECSRYKGDVNFQRKENKMLNLTKNGKKRNASPVYGFESETKKKRAKCRANLGIYNQDTTEVFLYWETCTTETDSCCHI